MIKTLQKRFIAIAMLAIFMVLFLIIGSINVINYIDTTRSLDVRLSVLADNGGSFPSDFLRRADDRVQSPDTVPDNAGELPGSGNSSAPDDTSGSLSKRSGLFSSKGDSFRGMSEESAFDTRYFTVTLDASGALVASSTEHIAAISSEDAVLYAQNLFSKNKRSGYLSSYRYTATEPDSDGTVMYIFLDCQRDIDTFQFFLFASVSISVIGLLLFFLLVLFLSRLIVRPVAESYEKQKHFITDASHEIKTPLTIIDANTEVIEMENGESEWTLSIRNQIRRLTDLTNKLVFLSRMDEENTRLTMLDFSLSDAVEETAKTFEAVAAASHKQFSCEIASGVTYTGDETTIRQLVSLLLDNAMKYTPEDGSIRVSLTVSGKNKKITVWNTAESIAPGRHDELFERFYRADSSRNRATGGHGIGLSVAKSIVTAHKGKITAKSEDGHSMRFTVTL
jgi:signal transduction histidine kinase